MRRAIRPAALLMAAVWWPAVPAGQVPAAGGVIDITPIVHASVQVEHAGTVIQVDPWSLGNLSRARPADLVLVTDDQAHHLDVRAIQQLRKPGAPVVIPAVGREKIPDGIVLRNGETTTAAGVRVEAVAAYDVKPGAPEHPKGRANGYVITLGGRRIYFAGVTECVPEVQALERIDVAFMPMNIPPDRMTPADVAACARRFAPKVLYPYHYDQGYASRLSNPRAAARQASAAAPPSDLGMRALVDALRGQPIEVRQGDWYPVLVAR